MASVRKREDKWVVDYKDVKGVRRLKTFTHKKSADQFRNKVVIEVENDDHVPDRETKSIAELSVEYIKSSEDRVRDGRIGKQRQRTIEQGFRNSIVPRLGTMKITVLTGPNVEDFYRDMCTVDGLAPKSARARLQMLKQLQDYAIKRGYMKRKPVNEAIRELRGFREPRIRTFTPVEVTALLRATDIRPKGGHAYTHDMMRIMVNVATFCGLRFGEIQALGVQHIDFSQRVIQVRRSLGRFDGLKSPKTPAGNRNVPMPRHVSAMLRDWIETVYRDNPDGLLFCQGRGQTLGRVSSGNFHTWHWPRLLDRAGLLGEAPRLHFHALRHWAASYMIEIGFTIVEVAEMLGHAKFDLTLQTYAHPIIRGNHRQQLMDTMADKLVEAPLLLPAPVIEATTALTARD